MKENFNVARVTNDVIEWIRDYFKDQPSAKGAIIGISGGKDSTIVSKLLVEALGKERVFGVLMPNGLQNDIEDSKRVVENLGIKYRIVNIEKAYCGLISELGDNISQQALTNVPPRLRMATLYAIGSSMGYRVAGTGNKSESYVGYTTKWGDSACDFNAIGNLTTEEVIAIGDYLKLPKELVHKMPSDGLTGKSDEDNLGFTYADVNKFIENGTCGNSEIDQKIRLKHEWNKHKGELVPKYNVF